MRNLWNDAETPNMDELDLLVYQSRLIGADPSLVVWGGGNTSIKVDQEDFRGRDTRTMIIKGSGSDLKTIERRHFPGLRLEDILPLFERDSMSDEDMVDYLNKCMLDPSGPRPSIETLLHAFLPYKSVAHSHADSVVALTNNGDAQQVLHAVYGDDVAVIEYIRPGFILSKKVGEAVRGNPHIKGVVLVNHGLFTWGGSTKAAYDVHIEPGNPGRGVCSEAGGGQDGFRRAEAEAPGHRAPPPGRHRRRSHPAGLGQPAQPGGAPLR